MIQIVPAILSTSEGDFKRDLDKITSSHSFEEGRLHIDFMDNQFVPNQSIEPDIVKKYPSNFSRQAHLMVDHPLEWLEKLKVAGFEAALFHAECKDEIKQVISKARSLDLRVGVAVNHDTPIEQIADYYGQVDEILLMAIVPGFQGQPFIPEALNKIRQLSEIKQKSQYQFQISVDGHVSDETARSIVDSGADILIVGSYLLKGDPDEQLEKLWEILNS